MCDVLLLATSIAVCMLLGMEVLPVLLAFRVALFIAPVCNIEFLQYQASCCTASECVLINRMTQDGRRKPSRWIYLRQEAVEQWNGLESLEKCVHIEGSPGTGKSTLTWAWACYMAASTNIVWVQCDPSGGVRIRLLVAGSAVFLPGVSEGQVHRIKDQMARWARLLDAHIVIVDGITRAQKNLFGEAAQWANKDSHRKAVLVSSAQLVLPEEYFSMFQIARLPIASWSIEQYEAACENCDLFNQVREKLGWTLSSHGDNMSPESKRQLLDDKFHCAGASARWMFDMSRAEVNSAIDTYIRCVPNCGILADGVVGDRSDQACNHLYCVDDRGRQFFVSKAVMRALAQIANNEDVAIKRATQLGALYRNGAFDGWVFEYDFLLRSRFACDASEDRSLTVNADERWPVHRRVMYDTVDDLAGVRDIDFSPKTWYFPTKCNQGGFDAVMVTSPTTLRFVQLTVAKTHSCKLQYLRAFGKTWEKYSNRKLTSVEFVAVLPPDKKDAFKWQRAESSVPWPIRYATVAFARTC